MNKLYNRLQYLTLTMFLTMFMANIVSAQCTYTLNLFDSFGDGWNGGVLTISVNGEATSYTIDTGNEAVFTIDVNTGDNIVFDYVAGSWTSEVSYEFINHLGEELFADGPSPSEGEVFTMVANCSGCGAPQNITPVIIGGDFAQFSFDVVDDALSTVINYGLLSDGMLSSTLETTETTVMFESLEESTDYQFVMRTLCEGNQESSITDTINFTTKRLNDIGVTEIVWPQTTCGLGMEKVRFNLVGFGSNPQSLFSYNFSVNGESVDVGFPADGFYTGVIGLEDTVEVTFDTEYDFSEPGEYEIAVWSTLEGDVLSSNDTAYFTIYSTPTVSELDFSNLFTENGEGWTTSGEFSSWEYGSIAGGGNTGDNVWATDLDGNYNNSESSYLKSACFDFSSVEEDQTIRFGFYTNFSTENGFDRFWLEGSMDGGITWDTIGTTGSGLNWYNGMFGTYWDGNSGGWIYAENNLDGFQGEANCQFRFAFKSDGSVSQQGIAIDDVSIYLVVNNDLRLESITKEGTNICGDEEDIMTVDIQNTGTLPQSEMNVYYQIAGQDPVMETVNTTIEPLGAYTYSFNTPFNSTEVTSDLNVTAWVELVGDEKPQNDTLSVVFESPLFELPVVVDFEDQSLPDYWSGTGSVGNGHNAPSYCFFSNLYGSNPSMELTTGILGPINDGNTLTFDYRYTDWSAGTVGSTLSETDSLIVEVSTDCGASFTVANVLTGDNHTPTAEYTNISVDLTEYVGETIIVRFRGVWGVGDYYLDFDNINIIGCPVSLGLTVETTDAIGDENGSAIINATGGQGPYTYSIEDLDALEAGDYDITVTDANGCIDMISFTIESITSNNEIDYINKYDLFPNPTANLLNLDIVFEKVVNTELVIMNSIGQLVYRDQLTGIREINQSLDVNDWSTGVYFLHIVVDGERSTRSFIKQ